MLISDPSNILGALAMYGREEDRHYAMGFLAAAKCLPDDLPGLVSSAEHLPAVRNTDEDPKVIYLAPACEKDSDLGRMWSEDGAQQCECGVEPPHKAPRYILDTTR
jgi:hypothetical protein